MNHVFSKVLDTLKSAKYITDEDVGRLADLLDVLTREVVDINDELRNQPKHQLTAAYYAKYFRSLKNKAKSEKERQWYAMQAYLSKTTDKRPTEAQVTATLMQDPSYVSVRQEEDTFEYFADQLEELRAAFIVRARMVEQLSNNGRFTLRDEQEEVA